MYGTLSNSVNPVIDLIIKGAKLGNEGKDNASILALCYYLQGAILGQLGLCFDQAMIMKENTDPATVQFSPYTDVMNAAIESLEKSIHICDSVSFQLNANVVNGYILNSERLKRLSHSYIARF